MKCVCVIILFFCIVSAREESKVRKDSETQKSGAINATIPSLRRHLKPLIPQSPFKTDSPKLRLTVLPPMLSPPLVQETKTAKPTKVKFNPPILRSTPHTTNDSETKTPEPTNLLVTTPRASPTTARPPVISTKPTKVKFNLTIVRSTPHSTNESDTKTPEPTNLLVTTPRASPTTARPPVISTKPTKVKFNPPIVRSKPHTTNETDTKTPEPTNLLVTTPRASPTTARPPVISTKPTKVKFNPPIVRFKPNTTNETDTKTPEPTNLLVTTPRASPTTARPPVTSTKIPYWKAKSAPPSTSSEPLILVSKQSSARKSAPILLKKPYNPCAPLKKPPLPDFSAPGRRISEVKCFDYIWELKVREDEAEQENECDIWRARGGITSDRIVGGNYAISGDYPNMGAVGWKAAVGTWKFMCGCTLISHNFVLTAAHCSSASELDKTIADVKPQIIRLGGTNIQDVITASSVDATIVRIINHPKYKSPKKYFDIALMELDKVLKFTKYIQPACLWTKDSITRYGDEAQVTGWGVVESGSLKTSPKLRAATVDIIDFHSCNRLLRQSCNRNWCGLQPEQLCAGKLGGGVDACQGDSGGPLQVRISLPIISQGTMHYVLGVTSFGVGCALPGLPGVYTKVSKFLDWIEGIVWPGQNGTAPL